MKKATECFWQCGKQAPLLLIIAFSDCAKIGGFKGRKVYLRKSRLGLHARIGAWIGNSRKMFPQSCLSSFRERRGQSSMEKA